MANTKISALTSASTPLAGTETLPIVQSGSTVKATVANIVGAGTSPGSFTNLSATGATELGTATSVTNKALANLRLGLTATVIGQFTHSAENIWNGTTVGEYSQITFGYNALGLTYATVAAGYVSTSSAGFGKGDYVVATRDVTTDTAPTVRTRVTASGDYKLETGNLIPNTAAKGVNYTANTAASGMTSQLLNWYEEGTWTVTTTNITIVGTPTYTGVYTRIGRQVTFSLRIQSTTSTSSVAGTSNISVGFPFVSSNKYFVASVINTGTIADIGNGLVGLSGGNTIIYLPTWTALADVTISGYYFV